MEGDGMGATGDIVCGVPPTDGVPPTGGRVGGNAPALVDGGVGLGPLVPGGAIVSGVVVGAGVVVTVGGGPDLEPQ